MDDFCLFVKNCMKHASQAAFGMAEPCALPSVDKWDILSALTKAAPEFGVSHRTLSVLKTLMTFLPEQMIAAERGGAVVFPSNRKLSERLNGMPESTMRRHLAKLVETGIVCRQDSPNRKRFARNIGADRAIAYGFDLSPLAVHAAQVHAIAAENALKAERIAVLRDRLALLRQEILASCQQLSPLPQETLERARLTLRRRTDEADLTALVDALTGIAATLPAPPTRDTQLKTCARSAEMSGSDNQNGRHIQYSNKSISDSEGPSQQETTETEETAAQSIEAPLQDVLSSCHEYRQFFPDGIRSWHDLTRTANQLVPMMGIEQPVFHEAERIMGSQIASTLVLCMLERVGEIRSPGAYLRRLSQKAQVGQFSIKTIIASIRQRQKLSADNFETVPG
ncbi:plasmid replication protein RepC-8 (plasmid) [Phaeobacter gallaeciensis]|uniref:Plasmid replication protein RepC-8 n=1 Tax=Phaeobacter gallaeciensis TaxID=60890 RepID=A0AAC9ZBX8_9RHOB|nr:plasmid replication protein RepC-8 [Phaeobacter gallaeciensis]ATE99387.1 plasmid replication protein RepC-8 [Phaeobacter gallaeciensis]ATF03783.1 plasmid replication protein RepC-8 [Phaeobacter gallaeciensis]ATF07976.1 plasmid replication protein RepC-8 [Phaeobacter gallaeciensis]